MVDTLRSADAPAAVSLMPAVGLLIRVSVHDFECGVGPPGQRSEVRRGELILGGDFSNVN